MKITLIHPNIRDNIAKRGLDRFMTPVLTPLGIASIASYLRNRNYEVTIIDAHAENITEKEVLLRIKRFRPGILGFSLPIEAADSARIAGEAKRLNPDIITVIGGVIPSALPQLTLERYPVFDFAVIGEGEIVFHSLIKTLERKGELNEVKGIAYRLDGEIRVTPRQEYIKNLDSLPYPARDLLLNNLYGLFGKGPLALVEASRGCSGNCWFCTIGKMFGNKPRKKNPPRVVDEIEECYDKYHINFFGFADSTFTADKDYVYSITNEIIKRNLHKKIRWRCVTRVDCVDSPLLLEMRRAGCREVGFGVEFIDQEALNFYQKGIILKNIKDAFLLAKAAKISPFALMIINQYDKNINNMWGKTVEFLKKIGAEHIILRPLVIYPQTSLHNNLLKKGHIKNNDYTPFFKGEYLESAYIDFKGLVNLMNTMYTVFYLRISFSLCWLRIFPAGGSGINSDYYLKAHKNSMVDLFFKLPFYWLFRKIGKPEILPFALTLKVTNRCNSRCKTCNVYNDNNNHEMTLEELEKTFSNFKGDIFWLTITGGEPFLREDLTQICRSVYKHIHPRIINIPTNGILYKIIPQRIEEILGDCPDTRIILNLSLDSFGKQHDEIRGVENNFEFAMNAYRQLRKINNPNFTLQIYTTISKYNAKDFVEFSERLTGLKPDNHIIEIAGERLEFNNSCMDIQPDLEDYFKAVSYLKKSMLIKKCEGLPRIIRSFRLQYYDLASRILKEKKQIIPCYAGFSSAYICADGQVWACSVKGRKMGNLRDFNYDFSKIWFAEESNKVRKEIKDVRCFCPAAGLSYVNMLCDANSLISSGLNFLKLSFR